MNTKFLVIGLLLVVIVGGGVLYRTVFLKGQICGSEAGEHVEISMITKENKWQFDPPLVEVKKCDHVTLNIYNEDEYDHGFAIDLFGVNKRLTPKATTTLSFRAGKAGEFVFYCSVPCGEGHLNHKGKLVVFDIVE